MAWGTAPQVYYQRRYKLYQVNATNHTQATFLFNFLFVLLWTIQSGFNDDIIEWTYLCKTIYTRDKIIIKSPGTLRFISSYYKSAVTSFRSRHQFFFASYFRKVSGGESPVGLGSTLHILLATTDPPSHSPENYVTPQKSTNSSPPPDTWWHEWSCARGTHFAARSVPYIWVLRLPK